MVVNTALVARIESLEKEKQALVVATKKCKYFTLLTMTHLYAFIQAFIHMRCFCHFMSSLVPP